MRLKIKLFLHLPIELLCANNRVKKREMYNESEKERVNHV